MTSAFPPPQRRPTLPSTGTPKDRSLYHFRSSSTLPNSSTSSLSSVFGGATSGRPDADCRTLVAHAFVPHIAVHASTDTNELAREKGFIDFKDMIRPYGEQLGARVSVRDSQGISNFHDDFVVRLVGLAETAESGEHWETGMTHGRMNGKSEKSAAADRVFLGGNIDQVEELVNWHLERTEELIDSDLAADRGSSFYKLYLRRLLSALPLSPHETFSHPVACVIAISSRTQSPIEALRNLYAEGAQVPLPSYVNTDYLRYYVLVHDEDRDDITKSMALFDQMKRHFGLHCHLLRLRSGGRAVLSDDDSVEVPKSQWRSAAEELAEIQAKEDDIGEQSPVCLPESDTSAIILMVREMTQLSVIPWMERCIATWNDQVASRRRGLSGRFLSMSKRYFGNAGSRNSTSASSNYDPVTASYLPSSPEAQMRKLADFAFMLRDWKLAHSVYDMLRTDFNTDKAWKHTAGAQEMTVVSLVLTGAPLSHKTRADVIEPLLDLACYSYVSRCAETYAALRCLLVAVELLRLRGGGSADEGAKWAMRARDMSALGKTGHALVTERVAACYGVRQGTGSVGWGNRRRKSAMWTMLAASEWVAAGKAAQARHCLDGAVHIYGNSKFAGIRTFVEELERQSLYAPLVDISTSGHENDEEEEVESERLDLGSKRRSIVGPPAGEVIESEKVDDGFGES